MTTSDVPAGADPIASAESGRQDATTVQTGGHGVAEGLDHRLSPLVFSDRYAFEGSLGKGGMGEVQLIRDAQIGRRVALKRLTEDYRDKPGALPRFVREARIQARLEHPAIVPVYDLGTTPDGEPFFTMKRLRGVTLREVLRRVRSDDEQEFRTRFNDRRLLADFSRICLAIDFAHRMGVVHRDIKPANIMFGDFGEVYLLDWGIAKSGETQGLEESREVVGTPRYMAPEQSVDSDAVSEAADVFSLGCVLSDLLHVRDGGELDTSTPTSPPRAEDIVNTVKPWDGRPERSPELDELCMRTLDAKPGARPTARELHEGIEAVLAGERDLELRKTTAERHASEAAEQIEGLGATAAGDTDHEHRRAALRAVGRALALDPDQPLARRTLVDLLTRPPTKTPPEVERSLGRRDFQQRRVAARTASLAYLSLLLYFPLFFWAGVRDPIPLIAYCALALGAAAVAYSYARSPNPSAHGTWWIAIVSTATMASVTCVFGPLVVVPAMVAINIAAFAVTDSSRRFAVLAPIGLAGIGIPLVLELSGVLPQMYFFSGRGMTIESWAVDLGGVPALVMLAIAGFGNVITALASMLVMRRALSSAERELELHAWQIQQLVG